MSDEFKKAKPHTFDGEMKKSQDAEELLLGMNKFFRLHDYSENKKARITTFSLKGKEDIWCEDMNNVKGIHEEDLKKKYLLKRFYDDKAKELYESQMCFMTDDEYTSIFLELLRYVPYLREEKSKV